MSEFQAWGQAASGIAHPSFPFTLTGKPKGKPILILKTKKLKFKGVK